MFWRLFIFVWALLFSHHLLAATQPTVTKYEGGGSYHVSADDACAAKFPGGYSSGATMSTATAGGEVQGGRACMAVQTWLYRPELNTGIPGQVGVVYAKWFCPTGEGPFDVQGNQCPDPPVDPCGNLSGQAWTNNMLGASSPNTVTFTYPSSQAVPPDGRSTCVQLGSSPNYCTVSLFGSKRGFEVCVNGECYRDVSFGSAMHTGVACSPTPANNDPGNKSEVVGSCPTGKCPGTINGTNVCVPCTEAPGATVKTPEGEITKTYTNGDGHQITETAKTSTSCTNGSCITTTTTTVTNNTTGGSSTTSTSSSTTNNSTTNNNGGTDDGSSEANSSGDGFCKENPGSVLCKDSSFSGDCSGGFSFNGDAIQGALAREVHQRNCQLYKDDDQDGLRFSDAASGSDGKGTQAMKDAAAAGASSVGVFDTGGYGWSRSCPADPVIPLSWADGAELTIPFSRICGPLGLLAAAAVAMNLLGCMVFVVKA